MTVEVEMFGEYGERIRELKQFTLRLGCSQGRDKGYYLQSLKGVGSQQRSNCQEEPSGG